MYQYDSKSKAQPEKSKANTPVSYKSHKQAGIKIPIQTKSLFSFSRDIESGDEEKEEQKLPKSVPDQPNNTGIPTPMKSHFEALSGFSFDDVKVHYNSDKPAQLQALAYTQGNQVYVAPGQEKHLGHELRHVVQQKQGRVKPTANISGLPVNTDSELEKEADADNIPQRTSATTTNPEPIIQGSFVSGTKFPINIRNQRLIQDNISRLPNELFVKPTELEEYSGELKKYDESLLDVTQIATTVSSSSAVASIPLPSSTALTPSAMTDTPLGAAVPLSLKGFPVFFKGKIAPFTTVGFEHEFSTFKSPHMKGLTHVVLAKSAPFSPFTGLSFSLETDSGDKLELVSPPLLIETGKTPLPNPEAVALLNTQIEEYLFTIGYPFLKTNEPVARTLLDVVKILNTDLEIDLNLDPAIYVRVENIGEDSTFQTDIPHEEFVKKFIVTPMDSINPQVNFATDSESYHRIISKTLPPKRIGGGITDFYENKYRAIKSLFSTTLINPIIIDQLSKTIMQIPIQNASVYLTKLKSQKMDSLLTGKEISGTTQNTIIVLRALVSFVKDVGRIWLKDHLSEFILGVDPSGASSYTLSRGLGRKPDPFIEKIKIVPNDLKMILAILPKDQTLLPDFYSELNRDNAYLMQSLVCALIPVPETIQKAYSKIYYNGVRSDTFVGISEDQNPPAFRDKKLHLAELRPSGSYTKENSGRIRALLAMGKPTEHEQ